MIELFQISSLEKVLLDKKPKVSELTSVTALRGERVSYQIAFKSVGPDKLFGHYTIESELAPYIKVYNEGNVSCELPAYPSEMRDDDYIAVSPCLLPDVLYPETQGRFDTAPFVYHALWITVDIPSDAVGSYDIAITFVGEKYEAVCKKMTVSVVAAELPAQTLKFTQWFHCDCIASVYNVPVFSEEHWTLMEKFVRAAVSGGINMILTPIFTPPLDTAVGGERPTVQLVGVKVRKGEYTFDFSLLGRWIKMCRDCGIRYFELSHLFTQWGAEHAPKIIADTENGKERIFGWQTDACSEEYTEFLRKFLPELRNYLESEGVSGDVLVHISDEPPASALNRYLSAKKIFSECLPGYHVSDALSDYEFYESGAVESPVVSLDHLHKFIENGVKNLWTYYCCGQGTNVSNRFIAMPSYRNRIIGVQLYKYDIKGFLHWGYNFYYTQQSRDVINPFTTTDSGCSFPSGDPFSVYPGEDGPLMSLRFLVFAEALQDMRALQLLETLKGREYVLDLIEKTAKMTVTVEHYPRNTEYLLRLREKVNAAIAESI